MGRLPYTKPRVRRVGRIEIVPGAPERSSMVDRDGKTVELVPSAFDGGSVVDRDGDKFGTAKYGDEVLRVCLDMLGDVASPRAGRKHT